jgi:transketolase
MRKQLPNTIEDIMSYDPRLVMLLGDMGVHSFRACFQKYGERTYNIGILEQATISVMAGLALTGFIPVFHTIAPFMVERALEQIKLDFSYQGLIGQFVSIGASYDYSALGLSHQAPGDVQALLSIPNINIYVPGSPVEFDALFKANYDKHAGYYRLTERGHGMEINFPLIRSTVTKTVVIAVGPMLRNVYDATLDIDNIDIIYCNTIRPFTTGLLLAKNYDTIILVTPFYEGTLYNIIKSIMVVRKFKLFDLSMPKSNHQEHYGTVEEHEVYYGLDPQSLKERITKLL